MDKLITKNNLWRDATNILAFHNHCLIAREEQVMGGTSYQSIRYKLMELMTYPSDVRKTISVRIFLQEGTNVSRSHIDRILLELNQGGYVCIHNGRLDSISFLPLSF